MAEISAQDAHCATDCSGGKSFHRIIELEIGSRPEIRRELNLINRNLQFITMTGKRWTMTDILVSNISELQNSLMNSQENFKCKNLVRCETLRNGSERVVFLCAVFCAKSAHNTQKEKCRPLIGQWRPHAALSLVKSQVINQCQCMQILTLLDVTLLEGKMLIWELDTDTTNLFSELGHKEAHVSTQRDNVCRLRPARALEMIIGSYGHGGKVRWGLRCEPRPRPRQGFMRRTFNWEL